MERDINLRPSLIMTGEQKDGCTQKNISIKI